MKIGQVASQAGVSIDTVRYYERRGILPAPMRRPSGYRVYNSASVDRIVLARRLREMGMHLDEIASALAAHDGGGTCRDEVWRLEAVRDRVEEEITRLSGLRDLLGAAIGDCADGRCTLNPTAPRPRRSGIPPR